MVKNVQLKMVNQNVIAVTSLQEIIVIVSDFNI